MNTTEVVDDIFQKLIKEAEAAAARLNSHDSSQMVATIYDLRNKERKEDHLKEINNSFA